MYVITKTKIKCYTFFKYYEFVYNNYNFCVSHAAYAVYKNNTHLSGSWKFISLKKICLAMFFIDLEVSNMLPLFSSSAEREIA